MFEGNGDFEILSEKIELNQPRRPTSHWTGRGGSVPLKFIFASQVVCVRAAPVNSSVRFLLNGQTPRQRGKLK